MPETTDEVNLPLATATGCCGGGDDAAGCGCASAASDPANVVVSDTRAAAIAREANRVGQTYWRSMGEHEGDASFAEALAVADKELNEADLDELAKLSRRRFLKSAAASMALAGVTLTGCRRWPEEHVVPFAAGVEDGVHPGQTQVYATVLERNGVGYPVAATSVDGRPIKLDGNAAHPSASGASDVFTQATTLDLYDPDRPKVVTAGRGETREAATWGDFIAYLDAEVDAGGGEGTGDAVSLRELMTLGQVAVLAEPASSATLVAQRDAFVAEYPQLAWYTWTPLHRDGLMRATSAAFGAPMRPHYDLARAARVVSFGHDFLGDGPDQLNLTAGWSARRKTVDEGTMSRLYCFEAGFSLTGAAADHRTPVANSEMVSHLAALANKLGVAGVDAPGEALSPEHDELITLIAADLREHAGHSVVMAGEQLDPAVQHLAFLINQAIGAVGADDAILSLTPETAYGDTPCVEQVTGLFERIAAGTVKGLIVLGGNPAYDAPADLNPAEALRSVPRLIHHSAMVNETSLLCDWHLPECHPLEAWGDAAAYDGTASVQQPLILPLFASKTRIEVAALLAGTLDAAGFAAETAGYELVFNQFRGTHTPNVKAWKRVLHDGYVPDSAPATASPAPAALAGDLPAPVKPGVAAMEVNLTASPALLDGRYANNGWLQELPQPMTKLTWDNALLISYADANQMGVNSGDVLEVSVGERSVTVPAMIVPGTAPGTGTLQLGYGRTTAGAVGGDSLATSVGVDAYRLRTADAQHAAVATVKKVRGSHKLATTMEHHLVDGVMVNPGLLQRPVEWVNQWAIKKRVGHLRESGYIIKESTLDEFLHNRDFVHDGEHGDVHLQMFNAPQAYNTGRHAWGMAIDMTSCTGCNACVIACQAENNIPVVGKDQVLMSREMHWLRIDRYFKGDVKGDEGNVMAVHQPVMCVHCENAPCEQVCPFAATVHDTEGINTMVYNRCAGTRYCSNNCPYKVRRYNYFDYHARTATDHGSNWKKPWLDWPDKEQQAKVGQVKRLVYNPDVTLRMRGVMEKCTYCVQRISATKSKKRVEWNDAKRNGRDYSETITDADGLQTACQQACPANAIVFGNLNDADAQVTRVHKTNTRAYDLLGELNTKPRTKYLARVTNPNAAALPEPAADAHDDGH